MPARNTPIVADPTDDSFAGLGDETFDGTAADSEFEEELLFSAERENEPLSDEPILVGKGEHLLRVAATSVHEGAKGKYAKFRFVALDGEGKGGSVFDNVSSSPAARFHVDALLDALGWPEAGQFNPKQAKNMTLRAIIKHDDYNGAPQAKIGTFLPAKKAVPTTNGATEWPVPPAPASPQQAHADVAPATPKQIETIQRMARERKVTMTTEGLTRSQASKLISSMISGEASRPAAGTGAAEFA